MDIPLSNSDRGFSSKKNQTRPNMIKSTVSKVMWQPVRKGKRNTKPKSKTDVKYSNTNMQHFKSGRNRPIEIGITPEQWTVARQRAEELGVLRNSITSGQSNVYGMVGEEVIKDYLGCTYSTDIHNYDLVSPAGVKIEVKTKKTAMQVPPKSHFECSVCNYNAKQRCDVYLFVRVSTKCNKAWLCGYRTKPEFMNESRYFKKGDTDSSNNYKVHASCWNMNISELKSINELKI